MKTMILLVSVLVSLNAVAGEHCKHGPKCKPKDARHPAEATTTTKDEPTPVEAPVKESGSPERTTKY